jgi:hypothetical protein
MAFIYLVSAANGKVVMADGGGGGGLIASSPWILEWESFVLEDHTFQSPNYLKYNDYVSLKSYTGHYVCAEGGGGQNLLANRSAAGPWEKFKVIPLENCVPIPPETSCNDIRPGPYTDRSELIPGSEFKVALQAANGMYVCAESGGASWLTANRTAIGPWETFGLGYSGGNRVRTAQAAWATVAPNQ